MTQRGTATIGIDIGGTKVLAVRLVAGEVVADTRTETGPEAPPSPATVAAVRSIWTDDVGAIGVGVAGLVDSRAGVLILGPHVAGTGVTVGALLESEFGVPVAVDNDANVAAIAEHRMGAGRGFDEMLLVTLGTGIGGGIIAGGRLYRGHRFAGEWGHMRVDPEGIRCACGRHGCWETVASGPALARAADRFLQEHPDGTLAARFGGVQATSEMVTGAAAAGDEEAVGLVARIGHAFGLGLGDLITMLDPQVVVVGGGLGSVGEMLLGPARRGAAEALLGRPVRRLPPIAAAQLGERANAIGAAVAAVELAV